MMYNCFFVGLFLSAAISGVVGGQAVNYQNYERFCGKRVVCLFNTQSYYKEGFTPDMIFPENCTHINYEFAKLHPTKYEIMEGDMALDTDKNFTMLATNLKLKNPWNKLKVLLSLGGWRDSTKKYSELAASPEKRKNFIEKAIPFLQTRNFDGLDFAWEYPNCWQGDADIYPPDKQNYVALLKELKAAFDKHGLILSVSVTPIKREILVGYDVKEVSNTVDFINVMTYDLHGPWEPVTGHHAQYNRRPGDKDLFLNVKGALETWVEQGADPSKLNGGIPTYAKTFTLADPNKNGLGAPAIGGGKPGPKTNQEGFMAYNEVCVAINEQKFTEKEDKDVGFYFTAGDQWGSFVPPIAVSRIVKHFVDAKYGGVSLKDVSHDDYEGKCFNAPFPMIRTAGMEFISAVRRKQKHEDGIITCSRAGIIFKEQ